MEKVGDMMVPPHQHEAERSILGAILVQNDALDKVIEAGLEPRDFYRETHQRIFEAALILSERREPIDLVTLSNVLRDRGVYEQVGGAETLTGLFEDSFAVGNITHYAKIVREKAILRRVIQVCGDISREAFDGVDSVEEYLDRTESKIFEVSQNQSSNPVVELKSVLMSNMATIEELSLKGSEITGVATGFHQFDRITTGLHGGQVIIIAARPGMGKTSWFLSALQNAALDTGKVVGLFSLEMSKEELGFRFLSGLSKIESRKLKTGKLSDRDWQKLSEAAGILSKARIFVDDSGALTAMDIRARSRRLLAVEKRLDLIVVDYLQLMHGPKGSGRGDFSREREISEISRGLKQLAKELKVPIIALSQLNRSVESRQDKRPNLSDLRESGAIEQDADIVCFIHREDYYDRESENRGIAEVIIAKNRSGETGTVRLSWLPQYTLFANLAEDLPGQVIHRPRPEKGDLTL